MTFSPDTEPRVAPIEPLPPALSSMWRLCKLGLKHERRLMLVAFVLSQVSALPDALLALWIMLLGKGVVEHRAGLVEGAAIGLALSSAATWLLRVVSTRVQRRFRDRVTIALEAHVARLQASIGTIGHQERTEYLDRLSMLRNQVFVLDHMYMSLFSTLGWMLRLVVTMALLMSVHPVLLVLALFALPPALTSTWRPAAERTALERGAPASRLARHLFTTATTAGPAKDVRVTGIGAVRGSDGTRSWRRRAGARPPGTRWRGRCSRSATSARSCSWRSSCARQRARCCSFSRPVRDCRPTSRRRSASSDFCAGSGWMARAAWRGSRITRRRWRLRAIKRCPTVCATAFASIACRSPIPARRGW